MDGDLVEVGNQVPAGGRAFERIAYRGRATPNDDSSQERSFTQRVPPAEGRASLPPSKAPSCTLDGVHFNTHPSASAMSRGLPLGRTIDKVGRRKSFRVPCDDEGGGARRHPRTILGSNNKPRSIRSRSMAAIAFADEFPPPRLGTRPKSVRRVR